MDDVLRQASGYGAFRFAPLPLLPREITEEAAREVAGGADYGQHLPGVESFVAHGLYDNGGTGIDRLPSGEQIPHQNRLVWLIAFVGVEVIPGEGRRGVHVEVIDAASARRLRGFRWLFPEG